WEEKGQSSAHGMDFCFVFFYGHHFAGQLFHCHSHLSGGRYHFYHCLWAVPAWRAGLYVGLFGGPVHRYQHLSLLEKGDQRQDAMAKEQFFHLLLTVYRHHYGGRASVHFWGVAMGQILWPRHQRSAI